MKQPLGSRKPNVMGGAAVFYGTRVPVQTLLDYLEAGESIDAFPRRLSIRHARAGHRFPGGSQGPARRIGLVRILLDECIDWRLSRDITGHEVKTARQMGWATLDNGELLALESVPFDGFTRVGGA